MTTILSPNNLLFARARTGSRRPSALVAIASVPVLLMLLIVSQVVARILLRSILSSGMQFTADPIAEIVGFLSIFFGLWVFLQIWSNRPFSSLGFEDQGSLRRISRGAVIAILMVAAMAGLAMIPGATIASGELRTKGIAALGFGLLTLSATGVQSSAEESLFRGWLMPIIGTRFSPWIGVLVSSLAFTIAHAFSGPTLLGFLNLFLFGTFAAFWALAEGGLWGACAWHSVWNWVEGSALGLAVDRSSQPGLLVNIRITGPDFITGGAFGPEGGLAMTAVLLIGISLILIYARGSR